MSVSSSNHSVGGTMPSLMPDNKTQLIASEIPETLSETNVNSDDSEPLLIQNVYDDSLQVWRRDGFVNNASEGHSVESPATPFVRHTETPNSNLPLRINQGGDSQTPLFAKVKNPFEETPTSDTSVLRSNPMFRPTDTPVNSAAARSKRALETFKRLGDEADMEMEMELEDGIVLGGGGAGNDDTFSNKQFQGDITTATVDEGGFDDEVNRALRDADKSTNEALIMDNSEGNIIQDRQPDDMLNRFGPNDEDEIQVPASVEKVMRSRSQALSQYSVISSDGEDDKKDIQDTPLPTRRFSLSNESGRIQAFSTPVHRKSGKFTQELSELDEYDEVTKQGSASADTQVIHNTIRSSLSQVNYAKRKHLQGLLNMESDRASQEEENTRDTTHSSLPPTDILREETGETTHQFDKYIWARIEHHKVPAKINQLFPDGTVDVLYDEDSVARIKKVHILAPLDIVIGDLVKLKNEKGNFRVTGLQCRHQDLGEQIVRSTRGFDTVYLVDKSKKSQDELQRDLSLVYCTRLPSRDVFSQFNDEEVFEKFLHNLTFEEVVPVARSGIFEGYCFCFTRSGVVENEQDFKKRKRFIEDSGGVILENGFTELLEPNGLSFNKNISLKSLKLPLTLSNGPCRTEKYLQALALGWPLLSETFIDDCMEDKGVATQWHRYLLAAGESQWKSSMMSLSIFPFFENFQAGKTLWDQAGNNSHILQEFRVLVINRSITVKKETLLFLLIALGVKSVDFVPNYAQTMNKAKKLEGTVVVYSDDSHTEVCRHLCAPTPTRTRTSQKTGPTQSNLKRFFPNATPAKRRAKSEVTGLKLGYINWEWIVQCVISSQRGKTQIIE